MTEEQKKKSSDNLAKAREARELKKSQEVINAVASKDSESVTEHDIESSSRAAENLVKHEIKSSDLVDFILPIIPGFEDKDQVFSRSINGVFFTVRRGVRTKLPRYIVDFIEEREMIQRLGDEAASKYKGDGLRI